MTREFKPLFLDILRVGLCEFSVNHPGQRCTMRIMEAGHKVTENHLQQAWTEEVELATKESREPALSKIVDDFICYQFTQGNSSYFKKLSWL